MGGDGGVIASNRKFMRGAGTADCVGDIHKHAAQKFNAKEAMTTCALTKTPLSYKGVVADPYGHLYHKEAAVQALLERKQQVAASATNSIGPQVRRLSDLYEVRFHRDEANQPPTCPISGKALTGSIAALVLVPGKDGMPNVVSESALSMISSEELEAEYGVIRRKVRLAPNPILLEKIKEEISKEQEQEEEERRRAKKDKKKDKKTKRKRGNESSSSSEKKKRNDILGGTVKTSAPTSMSQQVQSRVDSAIQQNSILSSLFTNKNAASKISEKDRKSVV